jgi:RNA polymerase sigma-70 factor, ECF subfamily
MANAPMDSPMSSPINSIGERPLTSITAEGATERFWHGPPEIEREVVSLFEQFRGSLLRYVLSFGLAMHDGEEITQEVFLALFRHLTLGKSRKNLRGWIFCVAHNLALRQRQANQRLRDGADQGLAEAKLDPSPSPEEQVLRSERQRRLVATLQALPEQDRSCLNLRAEGLRYREIARVLGISLGAVSLSLTRSLTRLMRTDNR